MQTEIISAIIAAVATLSVCLVNNHYQKRKYDTEQDKRTTEIANVHEKAMIQMEASLQQTIAILTCKMDDLTAKVTKHNQLVERVYKLESDTALLKEKQSVANHRLDDLERSKHE